MARPLCCRDRTTAAPEPVHTGGRTRRERALREDETIARDVIIVNGEKTKSEPVRE